MRKFITQIGVSILLIIATFYLAKLVYDKPRIRFSREVQINVQGVEPVILKSPFYNDEDVFKSELRKALNQAVSQNSKSLSERGIEIYTQIWICLNGERKGMQHVTLRYLRQLKDGKFQFWEHKWRSKGDDYYEAEQIISGSLEDAIQFYWSVHLSELLRCFNLDWEAENPEKAAAWNK